MQSLVLLENQYLHKTLELPDFVSEPMIKILVFISVNILIIFTYIKTYIDITFLPIGSNLKAIPSRSSEVDVTVEVKEKAIV